MDTQDLSIFLAVAEAESFSLAARRLGVTPSAVSKGVARLEEGLGVRLLARSTRKVALTMEGAAFRDRCRPILADLNEAREEILLTAKAPAGRLKISIPTALGKLKIIPVLPRFMARYPGVTLDVSTTDRMVDLIAEGVDVAIRVGAMADSALVARRLWRPPYMVCAAPDYLAAAGVPVRIEDLADHQCLGRYLDHLGVVRPWTFVQNGETVSWQPVSRLTIDCAEALVAAARSGAGIVQVNHYIVEDDIAAGRLVPLLTDFAPPGPPIQAVMLGGRQSVPRIRAFVDFMVERFAGCQTP